MKESKIRIFLLIVVSLIVISILTSNIGQNFKGNIASYDYTAKYMSNLNYFAVKSKTYQQYVNFSASYISKFMRANNFDTLVGNKYIDEWNVNLPSIEYASSLEVIKNGRIIRKYTYGADFFEDFRGSITTGIVRSTADYANSLEDIHHVLNEVLLYDGYKKNTTPGAIALTDSKLRALGASGIITPCNDETLTEASGYFKKYPFLPASRKGLAKLVTTNEVFSELKDFGSQGCIVRLMSGGSVKPVTYKNIYCVIKGEKPKFKPIVLCTYLDGFYSHEHGSGNNSKGTNDSFYLSKNYQLTPSILMDCMRVVNKQRLRKPDRTIIFAFLSGYGRSSEDENSGEGMNRFVRKGIESNLLLLNGLGLSDKYSILYSKNSNKLSIDTSNILKSSGFDVLSRKRSEKQYYNTMMMTSHNMDQQREIPSPNYYRVNSASKFILGLIEEECYNVNLLTGSIRHFLPLEKFVRVHSAALALLAILLLIAALFLPSRLPKRKEL